MESWELITKLKNELWKLLCIDPYGYAGVKSPKVKNLKLHFDYLSNTFNTVPVQQSLKGSYEDPCILL